ncbi:MAG: homocysteine S-methyltransferase family protein [Rhodoferax sp.]
MAYEQLMRDLRAGDILVLDGATGTELQRRGAPMDPASWCGPATLGNDRLLQAIHADYILAGSRVVTANTFAASPLMLGPAGLAHRSGEIIERAVAAARAARDTTPGGNRVVVAGSLSHMVPVASGTAVVDLAQLPSTTAVRDALFAVAHGLKASGCELILLEMMYEPNRVALALEAALSTGLPVWFGLSARRGSDGGPVCFHHVEDLPISAVTRLIPPGRVDVAGVMHTGAEIMQPALEALRQDFAGPLMAYPDSGYFEMPDWRFVDIISPERYEAFCVQWLQSGVQLVGGCCGLGVEHIRAASRARETVLAQR